MRAAWQRGLDGATVKGRAERGVTRGKGADEGRSHQLDSLRLVAILGVLFDHGGISEHFLPGQVGVRFFLLLSGFLITRTLIRYAGANWRDSLGALRSFYAKRALRIWPLYYAIIVVLLVTREIYPREALVHALFVTNFVQAYQNHWQIPSWFLPHFWTICVQEQFYLVWPLLFVALGAVQRVLVLLGMLALAVLFRLGMWLAGLEDQVGFQTLPLAAFDALAVGGLLAIGQEKLAGLIGPRSRAAAVIAAIGLALAGLADAASAGFIAAVLLPTLWLLPLAVLVLGAFEGQLGLFGRWLDWPVLVFLGRISLGIYLLHLPVALAFVELGPPWLLKLVEHRTWSAFAINTTGTLLAAVASWFLFEKPLQRLRRYLPYDRPAKQAGADRRAA